MAPSLLHACFSGFGDPPLTCRRQRCYFCILLWELVVSACLCCGIASSDVHICHDRVRLGRGTSTSHQLDGIALHKISQGYRQLVMNSGTGSCSIRNICDLGESRRCYVRLEYVNASSQIAFHKNMLWPLPWPFTPKPSKPVGRRLPTPSHANYIVSLPVGAPVWLGHGMPLGDQRLKPGRLASIFGI